MALRHSGAHGDNCEVQCSPDVRKKPHFTHARDNLRGDVSGKRFSTHAMERNVARIGEGRCGNDEGMSSAWGEDGECVGCEMWDCAGWELWG